MAKRTHHKHSSKKGFRRLLDSLAVRPGQVEAAMRARGWTAE